MDSICRLTVFFENAFWVAVYERECNQKYEACRIVFGAEPKDHDIYDFINKNYYNLKFSPSIESCVKIEKHINPKRMQRNISNQLINVGVGTKAQQALKLQHEKNKLERKIASRKRSDLEKERLFELHQQKRKDKHRGR